MSQKVDIVGRYNTVVQVVGDGNTVVASHAHLELYLPPKVENPQGIELLDPKSRAIPFIGRVDELMPCARGSKARSQWPCAW